MAPRNFRNKKKTSSDSSYSRAAKSELIERMNLRSRGWQVQIFWFNDVPWPASALSLALSQVDVFFFFWWKLESCLYAGVILARTAWVNICWPCSTTASWTCFDDAVDSFTYRWSNNFSTVFGSLSPHVWNLSIRLSAVTDIQSHEPGTVSYTHLTLPTNAEV